MSDIGIGEIALILVIALLVFGPDRLPGMVKEAASFVNDLRKMVANARRDLSDSVSDLGIDEKDWKTLTDLRNPKSFVRDKVLDGADLKTFGLDEFEEVGEELELTDGKRRKATNGAGAGSRRSTNGTGKASSKASSKSGSTGSGSGAAGQTATKTASTVKTGSTGTGSASGNGAAAQGGGESAAVTDAGRTTSTGARFDPDAT